MAKQSEATLLLKIKEQGSNLLGKTKSALSDLTTWAKIAVTALTSGAAVKAFKEQEEAVNMLNQSLINQGIYSKDLSDKYLKMADELQWVSKFGDENIITAQAQLQTYLGQTKVTKELMKATLDLATAKKIDLHSAAELVGKSIGTSMNAIKRQGVEVELTGSKQEKMGQLIDALNSKFEGQAETAVKGLGSISLMTKSFGEAAEVIGEKLAPFVIWLTDQIINLTNSMKNNQIVLSGFNVALFTLMSVFILLKTAILNLKELIVGVFSSLALAVMHLATGDFSNALKAITSGFSETMSNIDANNKKGLAEISTAYDNYFNESKIKEEKAIENKVESDKKGNQDRKLSAQEVDDFFKARDEAEINREMTKNRLLEDENIRHWNKIIANEKGSNKGLEAELEKRKYIDEQYLKDEYARQDNAGKALKKLNDDRVKNFEGAMNTLSGMQSSKNKTLVTIGKAAALANIGIDTARGALGVYSALSPAWAGPAGVAAGIIGAAAITAYGAEKAATVAGINLAEGGIVKSTPGGVQATIGEGGRDEAVIPLEGGARLGTNINITINGGLLGDASQAREFVTALDHELFRLRQANQSIAFDKGII